MYIRCNYDASHCIISTRLQAYSITISHHVSASLIPPCVWAPCEQCAWVIMIICPWDTGMSVPWVTFPWMNLLSFSTYFHVLTTSRLACISGITGLLKCQTRTGFLGMWRAVKMDVLQTIQRHHLNRPFTFLYKSRAWNTAFTPISTYYILQQIAIFPIWRAMNCRQSIISNNSIHCNSSTWSSTPPFPLFRNWQSSSAILEYLKRMLYCQLQLLDGFPVCRDWKVAGGLRTQHSVTSAADENTKTLFSVIKPPL